MLTGLLICSFTLLIVGLLVYDYTKGDGKRRR
jgi:hypothetical protein